MASHPPKIGTLVNSPHITVILKAKGGVAGTHTAIYYACALAAEHGPEEVLVLDADKGTRSIASWVSRRKDTHGLTADMPFWAEEWSPSKGMLPLYAAKVYTDNDCPKFMVIDMGADPEYASQAALLADTILMPTKPWEADYDTLLRLKAFALENKKARAAVLLTMVDQVRKGEAVHARNVIADPEQIGLPVLHTEIKKHAAYRAFYQPGDVPEDLYAYAAVYQELNGQNQEGQPDLNPSSTNREGAATNG